MKTYHTRTVLERISAAHCKAREDNKEVAYAALTRKEAETLHSELLGSLPHLVSNRERFLDDLSDPARHIVVFGVRLCLHGSKAHDVFEARR